MLSVAANTNRCSKNVTQDGKPVVVEKAPKEKFVFVFVFAKFVDVVAVTDVADPKFVIFAIPSPIRTNLPTSVETNVLAEAVIVTEPDVPDGCKVVVDVFVSVSYTHLTLPTNA